MQDHERLLRPVSWTPNGLSLHRRAGVERRRVSPGLAEGFDLLQSAIERFRSLVEQRERGAATEPELDGALWALVRRLQILGMAAPDVLRFVLLAGFCGDGEKLRGSKTKRRAIARRTIEMYLLV